MEYSLLINEVRSIRGLSVDSSDSMLVIEPPRPFWYDWWVYCCCCCCGPAEN
jgi:hypothetical protein